MAPQRESKRRRSRCGFPKKGHVCAAADADGGGAGSQLPSPEAEKKTKVDGAAASQDPPQTDKISALPDDVLRSIISFLPTVDAAQTQALSTRWRPLWRYAPLNLDDGELNLSEDIIPGAISTILSAHHGPIWRFSVTKLARVNEFLGDIVSALEAMLRHQTISSLSELRLHYRPSTTAPAPFPPAALRFSLLRVASFGHCSLPDTDGAIGPGGVVFPNLQELTLLDISNSEATLHAIVSACPAIRSLLLCDNDAFRHVQVRSGTLVSLGLCSRSSQLEELVIEDTPNLERLLMFRSPRKLPRVVRVISAPKLEVLGCLSNGVTEQEFGMTYIMPQTLMVDSIAMLRTVKILAFRIDETSLTAAIHVLRCFPCLQKLDITLAEGLFYPQIDHNGAIHNTATVECLDFHLKKMVLRNYRCKKSYAAFAKFFVMKARVLELLTIRTCVGLNKRWLSSHRKLLYSRKKVSANIRIEFSADDYFVDYKNGERTHQLLVADPFDD
uniref:F-box domain-containing protein n=1 Tax=Oryza brachyantha TaxID=4533 RepID=J3L8I5_ORYBR